MRFVNVSHTLMCTCHGHDLSKGHLLALHLTITFSRLLGTGGPDPLKNHKNIGFLSKTKPAFNVGPSTARQRNAIEMAVRWWADDGSFLVVVGSLTFFI